MQGLERAINTYQSENPCPTIPTNRMKEEKRKWMKEQTQMERAAMPIKKAYLDTLKTQTYHNTYQ